MKIISKDLIPDIVLIIVLLSASGFISNSALGSYVDWKSLSANKIPGGIVNSLNPKKYKSSLLEINKMKTEALKVFFQKVLAIILLLSFLISISLRIIKDSNSNKTPNYHSGHFDT